MMRIQYSRTSTPSKLLFLAFLISVSAGPVAASNPTATLWQLGEATSWAQETSPAAVESYGVNLKADLSTPAELAKADGIRLALPDGEVIARRTDSELRRTSSVWRGYLEDSESRVVLTSKNGFLVGAVFPSGASGASDATYELTVTADADGRPTQVLHRLTPELFPPCSTGTPEGVSSAPRSPATALPPAPLTGGEPIDPVDEITLLSVYSPSVRDAAGGVAAIEAIAQAAVDVANTAFIDSDMLAYFQLAHIAVTEFDETGSLSADLNNVRNDSAVAALRDAWSADMVGFLVNSGGCGIASVMTNPGPSFASSAFQVTSRGCAVGNLTYAHEHGHNMGFEHDPANGRPPEDASRPWSFGHFHSGSYRTVMSYSNQCSGGCSRVAHFSNPDIDHNSLPTGIAEERDNARTGDITAPIVTDFRIGTIFRDGFESGDTSAWTP